MSLSPPPPVPPNALESHALLTTKVKRIVGKVKDVGYLNFLEWADSADEHKSCVHVAAFHHPEHGAFEAYVKLYPNDIAKQIANEITGYLYAHALGIPQPARAFVANIPIARLRTPPGWIKAHAKERATLTAFCTTRLDGESAAVNVPASALQLLVDDVSQWEYLERTVAMDENVAQTDRHLNNLIRLSRKHFAIIDGGRLASGENGENWTASSLNALQLYRNRLSERIWSHKPHQTSVDKIMAAATLHATLISHVHGELRYWWGRLLEPGEAKAFEDFQAQRVAHLQVLLCNRYQMLI